MHLNDLSLHVKEGAAQADLVGLIFNTIGVRMDFDGYAWYAFPFPERFNC